MARLGSMVLVCAFAIPAAAQPAKSPARAKNDPRGFMGMGREVPCPAIGKAVHDPAPLAAKRTDPSLLVDLDGFLRPDIGVEEAVALLGTPVMCDGRFSDFGSLEMHLLPTSPAARGIELETKDGELVGIVLEYDPPVTIDMTAMQRRFGKPRHMSGPEDSFEAGGNDFDVKTKDFSATLMFSHRAWDDDPKAWKVHQIILRRSALADELPESFTTAADIDQLIHKTLRPRPPDTVDYFGLIGVFDKATGDHLSFRPGLAMRNVKSASMEKRTTGKRDLVHAVTITFTKPIAIGTPVEIPGVKRTLVKGKLKTITIERADP